MRRLPIQKRKNLEEKTKALKVREEGNNSIKSTIKPFFIGLILFLLLIIIFLGFTLFHHEEISIFLRGFIVFIIYGIYKFIASSSFFEVNEKGIKKGKKFYFYNEILRVDLYAMIKASFFLLPMPEEGIIVYLKNGQTISFKESYSTNFWKIRWFLDQKILQGKDISDFSLHTDYKHIKATHESIPIPISVKIIRILLIISIGLFIISLIDLLILNFINFPQLILIPILSSIFLLAFIVSSSYFERTDEHLIIKSLYLPFKKVIPVNQIKSITKKKAPKTIFFSIRTTYHREFKIGILNTSFKRQEDSLKKIKELKIPYQDFT